MRCRGLSQETQTEQTSIALSPALCSVSHLSLVIVPPYPYTSYTLTRVMGPCALPPHSLSSSRRSLRVSLPSVSGLTPVYFWVSLPVFLHSDSARQRVFLLSYSFSVSTVRPPSLQPLHPSSTLSVRVASLLLPNEYLLLVPPWPPSHRTD